MKRPSKSMQIKAAKPARAKTKAKEAAKQAEQTKTPTGVLKRKRVCAFLELSFFDLSFSKRKPKAKKKKKTVSLPK